MVFESLFKESKGKPISFHGETLILMDSIAVEKGSILKLTFKSTNSEWRQGIRVSLDGILSINQKSYKKPIILWEDTAPKSITFEVISSRGEIKVSNIWDVGDGVVQSWHNGAAMRVKLLENGIREYWCNDGHPDHDLDDLIFTLELT